MKYILKNAVPQGFIDWKISNWTQIEQMYAEGKTGADLWDLFPSSPSQENRPTEYSKVQFRTALLEEQFYLCAYCNERVRGTALDTKIDHYLPKKIYKPNLVFDYQNLLASCNGGERVVPRELSCDSFKKENDPVQAKIISPLSVDCVTHFDYEVNGVIVGKTEQATKTIQFFNLNCKRLVLLREKAIDAYINENMQMDRLITDEIAGLQTPYLENGTLVLNRFCMAIVCVLQNYSL
jgi:uncharacterized protein (TIGR02646 family)